MTDRAESVEAALLYQELGRLHFRVGDDQQAIVWAQKALELGQRLGAPEVLGPVDESTANLPGAPCQRDVKPIVNWDTDVKDAGHCARPLKVAAVEHSFFESHEVRNIRFQDLYFKA